MRILLVGVFSWGSTDGWKKLALERLGHRVVCCPYRDRGVREQFPRGEPFDLVFVSKGVPLSVEDFAHLATLGRAQLLWWPDPFERWPASHSEVLRTGEWDLSATSLVVLDKILDACGQPDIESTRILEGCDCEGPRPQWRPAKVEPALLHFGAMTDRRAEIIERVRAAGVRVDVLAKPLFGAQLQREVLRYAAVLGINSSPDLYSNRVQTVLAMGGEIQQESAPDLMTDFGALSRVFDWTDVDQLIENARDAVADDQPWPRIEETAVEAFDQFRWERVMERAVEFAVS